MAALYVTLAILAGSIMYLTHSGKMEDDGFLEELVEEAIEDHTGIDVDLSYKSDENDKD